MTDDLTANDPAPDSDALNAATGITSAPADDDPAIEAEAPAAEETTPQDEPVAEAVDAENDADPQPRWANTAGDGQPINKPAAW